MRHSLITLLALFLFGCSTGQISEPAAVTQSRDLGDSDHDGVINARDNCTQTPLTAVVDNDGCPVYVKRSEENDVHVLFANDSSLIPDSFFPEVQRMSDFLHKYPDSNVELKGHASLVGRHQYNTQLSLRRAEQVRKQLIETGIAPERIQTVGFGDTLPVKSDSEEQSNTLSRRVVAKVVGEKGYVVDEWTIFMVRNN
ncbi:OmpA family protein [Photobacterium chitinilyticum]|uniref:OmpA family protein n=1 Tax=Photobacterium chitinilyticum TaxID=2485123 RepID=A0A3S3RHG7_9GAMM|nr:OmpA family protein [Photobacterium chitinilyticum]RWX55507.1 OmpA family protein [Photobacterium chitinilyticum]